MAILSLDDLELALIAAKIDAPRLAEATRIVEDLGGSIVAGATPAATPVPVAEPTDVADMGEIATMPAPAG